MATRELIPADQAVDYEQLEEVLRPLEAFAASEDRLKGLQSATRGLVEALRRVDARFATADSEERAYLRAHLLQTAQLLKLRGLGPLRRLLARSALAGTFHRRPWMRTRPRSRRPRIRRRARSPGRPSGDDDPDPVAAPGAVA
jgi:hypothetical protein